MESHRYNFNWKDCCIQLALPLLGLLGFCLVIHFLRFTKVLPTPHPAADPDATYFKYKSKLAKSGVCPKIVLIGDSSCAAGVDSLKLSAALHGNPKVVNLGLIIGLRLDHYQNILETLLSHSPEFSNLAVLLVTPQFLRGIDSNEGHIASWEEIHFHNPKNESIPRTSGFEYLLGVPSFKNSILAYGLNVPLKGAGSSHYGFTSTFLNYLEVHYGSFIDPGVYAPPKGKENVEYELSPLLRPASETFRRQFPAQLKLAVGLTPVPESHIGPSFEVGGRRLLLQWQNWLAADYVLTNLPSRLPDGLFATGAHLNWRGQDLYTKRIAQEISNIYTKGD